MYRYTLCVDVHVLTASSIFSLSNSLRCCNKERNQVHCTVCNMIVNLVYLQVHVHVHVFESGREGVLERGRETGKIYAVSK